MNAHYILSRDKDFESAASSIAWLEKHRDQELHEIEIRPYKSKRTNKFNSYYWTAVVGPLAEFCGESSERMHGILCGEYFGWTEKSIPGRLKTIQWKIPFRTTTKNDKGERDVLATEDMQKFVEFVKSVSADMGVIVEEENQDH